MKFDVCATVTGSKHLGTIEADNRAHAFSKALSECNVTCLMRLRTGETMTNYHVKSTEPAVKDVVCEAGSAGHRQGVNFKVGGQHVLWLRPEGDFMLFVIDPARAADVGLQLDKTGRVKCVS